MAPPPPVTIATLPSRRNRSSVVCGVSNVTGSSSNDVLEQAAGPFDGAPQGGFVAFGLDLRPYHLQFECACVSAVQGRLQKACDRQVPISGDGAAGKARLCWCAVE